MLFEDPGSRGESKRFPAGNGLAPSPPQAYCWLEHPPVPLVDLRWTILQAFNGLLEKYWRSYMHPSVDRLLVDRYYGQSEGVFSLHTPYRHVCLALIRP